MSFFFQFFTKNISSHAYILSKKRPSLKRHNALVPIFCPKNVHSLKNTVFSCPFFQYHNEKPPAVMPIFGPKTSNLSNNTILWTKKGKRKNKHNLILANIIQGADGEKIGGLSLSKT